MLCLAVRAGQLSNRRKMIVRVTAAISAMSVTATGQENFRPESIDGGFMAVGLCADVTILEVDGEKMRFLDLTMPNATIVYSNEAHLNELLPATDLLIGAVLVPGAKAPKLITRAMLQKMGPGSVLVDIAIDQGGCVETSRPTTHLKPVYVEEGVIHYCVANM